MQNRILWLPTLFPNRSRLDDWKIIPVGQEIIAGALVGAVTGAAAGAGSGAALGSSGTNGFVWDWVTELVRFTKAGLSWELWLRKMMDIE